MLFMDLSIDNALLYRGQVVLGQVPIRKEEYLGFIGSLTFIDFQGYDTPTWDAIGGFNSRFQLMYLQDTTQPPLWVPLQTTPVQNLAVILGGQNCVIGLYDQLIDTALPTGTALPIGADAGYTRQSLFAPLSAYVVPGYWDPTYSV